MMNKPALIAALLLATPAQAMTVATFTEKPEAVMAKLVNRCIEKGRAVDDASATGVMCSKPMTTAQSFSMSFVAGTSMTMKPTVKDRYIIMPEGEGSKVIASSHIAAFLKNGQPFNIDDSRNEADAGYRAMFTEIGGAPQ